MGRIGEWFRETESCKARPEVPSWEDVSGNEDRSQVLVSVQGPEASVCMSLKEIDEQLLDSGNRALEIPEDLYTRRSLGTLNSSLPPSVFLAVTKG